MRVFLGKILFWICGLSGILWIYDMTVGGHVSDKPLGEIWYNSHAESLNFTQAIIERYLIPEIWTGVSFFLQRSASISIGLVLLIGILSAQHLTKKRQANDY